MNNTIITKGMNALFIICLLVMAWLYYKGYDNSIGWEVTTNAEVITYPAIQIDGELMDFSINADKYLLTETYSGGPIKRNRTVDALFLGGAWLGVCVVMVSASYLSRIGFIISLAAFTLLLNRLNFADIGLFGITNPIVVAIPFILLIGPLFFFHEYRKNTPFMIRLISLLIMTTIIAFATSDLRLFLDHAISHTNFSFAIAGLLFLFIIAEENVFAILFLITRGKGGQSNHTHFIILSLVYLANLVLYYLNKSGYYPNSFSFFDPYILLIISSAVAVWSLKFKASAANKYLPEGIFHLITIGLGIVLTATLSLAFFQGNDPIYESFHYFILYFHIGFAFFFLLYIIINFIDPLIQGLEIYKIAYKEQNFPYISARLGGFVVVLGFYFLSTQEAYTLLRTGYLVQLGKLEKTAKNHQLSNEYFEQAAFLGYNTHHPNYELAWNYSNKGDEYLTKVHFEKAAARYPSPYAYINHTMLDMDINPSKAQAVLQEAAQTFEHGEIRNNQGVLRMKNKEWEKALPFFNDAEASNAWNQAPMLNKWALRYKIDQGNQSDFQQDFLNGNYGVRSNIIATIGVPPEVDFLSKQIENAPILYRQSYLLNATPAFAHDSIAHLVLRSLEKSTNATFNNRLRKALAIHHYKNGEVNKAFRMMDFLQANSYEGMKGDIFNDLGVMALDQGANRLAIDFLDKAIEDRSMNAYLTKVEALARMGRKDEIPDVLLKIIEKDPGLTNFSNDLLQRLKNATFEPRPFEIPTDLSSLADDELISLLQENAFNEELLEKGIVILNDRGVPEAYDIILEATEINPYSSLLLIRYVLTAMDQNLVSYAEAVLPRIQMLVSDEEYQGFKAVFDKKKEEQDLIEWE